MNEKMIVTAINHLFAKFRSKSAVYSQYTICNIFPKAKSHINHIITTAKHSFKKLKIFTIEGIQTTKWHYFDEIINKCLVEYLYLTARDLLPRRVLHLRGHGGLKEGCRLISRACGRYRFVYKTDVKNYYGSINHNILLEILSSHYKPGSFILKLISRHLKNITKCGVGISRGSGLSPVLAGVYLSGLPEKLCNLNLERYNIDYLIYNDDILVFSSSAVSILRAKSCVIGYAKGMNLELRPEKSHLGLIKNGFSFTGFKYNHTGVIILADKTEVKFKNNYFNNLLFSEEKEYTKHFSAWVKGIVGKKSKIILIANQLKNKQKEINQQVKNLTDIQSLGYNLTCSIII